MSEEVQQEQSAPAPVPAAAPSAPPMREHREGGDDRGGPGGRGGARRRFTRRKVCYYRTIKAEFVDYKDVNALRRFVSDNGKLLPRRVTGTSAKFQRLVNTAVKRARYMALLPYSPHHR